MDASLLQDTISSIKLAVEISKSIINLRQVSGAKRELNELYEALLAANRSAFEADAHQAAMIEKIRNLKEELARIKAWEDQKPRYKLVSAWQGAVLYALKETYSSSEPPHWICTNCYEDGRKSILNPFWNGHFFVVSCPTCKAEFHGSFVSSPPKPQYAEE